MSYYKKSGVPLSLDAQWMQYKAGLMSLQSANSPILESVSIKYEELP